MAGPFYVDSEVNAGGTPDGLSWGAAFDSFWSVPTLAAGEIVYVASRHREPDVGAAKTLTGPTSGALALIYSVTTNTTTYEAGAQIETLPSYRFTFSNNLACYGVTFISGESFVFSFDSNDNQHFQNCTFKPAKTKSFAIANMEARAVFQNCTFDFSADDAATSTALFSWDAGGADTIPIYQSLFLGGSFTGLADRTGAVVTGQNLLFFGVDLSDIPSSMELTSGRGTLTAVNCKLPATVGVNTSAPTNRRNKVDLYNCVLSGAEGARVTYSCTDWNGSADSVTSISLGGGATSDDGNGGTQAFCHKLVGTASYTDERRYLASPWYYVWNGTTGSRNLDIYVGGSEALDNADVWAEYLYMGASGSEQYTFATTQRATPLTAAAEYTTTGGTWSGTGAPTEEYYLRSTVTINEKGWVMGRVCVGKASLTVYVDPRIVLS